MTKEELRKMMKSRRRTLSASRILFYSAIVTDKLVREEAYQKADTIFAYYSVSAELSMDYLYEQAWHDGKKVALPVCLPGNELEFRYYKKGMELDKGIYGIPEPLSGEKVNPEMVKPLFLIPGLVFDADGNRIGYGGGYYDRFLKKYPSVTRIMLAYEMQKTTAIPYDANDVPVDIIITETERYAAKHREGKL